MNIQIFTTAKSFDGKKAERYFKERRIQYQLIDMGKKGLSRGEFDAVLRAVGGVQNLVDPNARDAAARDLVLYLAPSQQADKLFENQQVIRMPIVRNGRAATVGYCPDTWKTWE